MKIYFIRHGETLASKEGLIQGSSDGFKNQVTTEGLLTVGESAKRLSDMIAGTDPRKVFLYSADQLRCLQTSGIISEVLQDKNLLLDENILFDSRLNGRSYGELESLEESRVKKPVYMLTHPRQAVSYALAHLGFKNAAKIEPKKEYADKVFTAIYEMFLNHEGKDDVVIVSATSDVYRIMQKDKDIHSMCYFGHEEVPYLTSTIQPFSSEKIATGELKIIEVGQPTYVATSDRFIPVWENLALRDYYQRFAEEQNQKM